MFFSHFFVGFASRIEEY